MTDPTNGAGPGVGDATEKIVQRFVLDQRGRCERGEAFHVEAYLAQQPCLASDPEAVLDLLYNEMMLREGRGEAADLDEYVRRFPHLAAQLATQFEVERALQSEEVSPPGWKADTVAAGGAPAGAAAKAFGGYDLLEVLGRGGMGVVYKARQRSLNRLVAVKMIHAGAYASPGELARLRIEAEAVAQLQHPNIVQIIEVGELDGSPFLALEYVAGGTLAQRLNGTPWPAAPAARFTETLARAVQSAHKQGIIHRDLKPANVLLRSKSEIRISKSETNPNVEIRNKSEPERSDVSDFGDSDFGFVSDFDIRISDFEPKITDFGLAKLMTGASSGLTATGDFLGTPSYTAPEQAMGMVHAIGPATDVYALGAILYELLTGRPPFQGTSPLETLDQVRSQEPVAPSRLQNKLPRDLETICLKCLEKDPRKRYASALLLAEDLRRFQAGQPIQARPVGSLERVLKWAHRRPAAAALIAVSAVAALSLAIGGWWSALALGRAADRENKQRVQAEANFAKAVAAVEHMLSDVGAVDLADVPQLEPVRKRLLLKAKAFFDEFLAENADNAQLRHVAGRAFSRLANIQELLDEHAAAEKSYGRACALLEGMDTVAQRQELGRALNGLGGLLKKVGRLSEAEAALRQALALREQLVKHDPLEFQQDLAASYHDLGTVLARMPKQRARAKEAFDSALRRYTALTAADPENAAYQRERARTLNNLGILLRTSDAVAAEDAFKQALGIHQALVTKHSGQPGFRRELARTYTNIAAVYAETGRAAKAEESFGRAIDLLKQLAVDFPSAPVHRQDLAGAYNGLGLFLEESDRFGDAERAYRESLRLREEIADAAPDVPEYQQTLANVCVNLGSVLHNTQQPAEADRYYQRAVSVLTKIALPGGRPAYHSDLGVALHQRAVLLRRRSRAAEPMQAVELVLQAPYRTAWAGVTLAAQSRVALIEARDCLAQAIPWQRAARAVDPVNSEFARLLYEHYHDLVVVELLLGNHRGVAAAARELPAIVPERAEDYVLAAECLARCLPLVAADAALDTDQRGKLTAAYAAEAVRLLQAAVNNGFRGADELKRLPVYEPLRRRADFQQLLDDLEKNRPRIG